MASKPSGSVAPGGLWYAGNANTKIMSMQLEGSSRLC